MRKLLGLVFAFVLGCSSSNGSPGGQGGTGGSSTQPTVCYDEFNPLPDGGFPVVPCCPAQPPDCSGVPDGSVSYPGALCYDENNPLPDGGFAVVPCWTECALPTNFLCFCACRGGTWRCTLDGTNPGGGFCGP